MSAIAWHQGAGHRNSLGACHGEKTLQFFGMSKKGHPGAHSSSFSFHTLDLYFFVHQTRLPPRSSSEEQAVC